MYTFETTIQNYNELVNIGFALHGHLCPAMPLGIRAALVALKTLGVERAKNKELYTILENGPVHANMCFGDGVQVGSGCTFGKGNIARTNESKNALTIIDKSTGRAVRVSLKFAFVSKSMSSEFARLRKEGKEPKDIDESIALSLIQAMLNKSDQDIFTIGEIAQYQLTNLKESFNVQQCSSCHEPVFEPGIRTVDSQLVCSKCSNYYYKIDGSIV